MNPMLPFILILLKDAAYAQSEHAWNGWFELNVLPYITVGYFGCLWVGKSKWRSRVLTAFVKKPDWSTTKGFRCHVITAYALPLDRFLKDNREGLWTGGGPVLRNSQIKAEVSDVKYKFSHLLINGSLGYNFSLSKHFYISPWTALSLKIAGDKDIVVNTRNYNLPMFNSILSLRLSIYLWMPFITELCKIG